MDGISLAGFRLALDVTGMIIMNGVGEVVGCWRLVFDVLHIGWGSSVVHGSGVQNSSTVVDWGMLQFNGAGDSDESKDSKELKDKTCKTLKYPECKGCLWGVFE